jgi:integrase
LKRVLPRHRVSAKHHPALPYAQLAEFITALRASGAGAPVKLGFEFLILTAARTSQVIHATWDEINLPMKTWTIPASRMKTHVQHRVPLADRCVDILEAAKAISNGGPYLFPGRRHGKPLSNMAFERALDRMKHGHITPHGFRSTFRDWSQECTNFPRAVCEAALAHAVKDKVEAAYLRTDLFARRRELMDEWARFATAPISAASSA